MSRKGAKNGMDFGADRPDAVYETMARFGLTPP
jgi:hypothetical protein